MKSENDASAPDIPAETSTQARTNASSASMPDIVEEKPVEEKNARETSASNVNSTSSNNDTPTNDGKEGGTDTDAQSYVESLLEDAPPVPDGVHIEMLFTQLVAVVVGLQNVLGKERVRVSEVNERAYAALPKPSKEDEASAIEALTAVASPVLSTQSETMATLTVNAAGDANDANTKSGDVTDEQREARILSSSTREHLDTIDRFITVTQAMIAHIQDVKAHTDQREMVFRHREYMFAQLQQKFVECHQALNATQHQMHLMQQNYSTIFGRLMAQQEEDRKLAAAMHARLARASGVPSLAATATIFGDDAPHEVTSNNAAIVEEATESTIAVTVPADKSKEDAGEALSQLGDAAVKMDMDAGGKDFNGFGAVLMQRFKESQEKRQRVERALRAEEEAARKAGGDSTLGPPMPSSSANWSIPNRESASSAPGRGEMPSHMRAALDSHGTSSGPKKRRRGKLPEHSTNLLKKWLFDHWWHPYPTEEEKEQLAIQTALTVNQISNWYTNARRRILPKQKPAPIYMPFGGQLFGTRAAPAAMTGVGLEGSEFAMMRGAAAGPPPDFQAPAGFEMPQPAPPKETKSRRKRKRVKRDDDDDDDEEFSVHYDE